MNAVDTNVFVYSLDVHEPVKQAKADALLAGFVAASSGTVLLWQVAGELLSVLRNWQNKGRVSAANIEANFRDVLSMFPLALPSPRVFARYFDLYSRFSLSHWDVRQCRFHFQWM